MLYSGGPATDHDKFSFSSVNLSMPDPPLREQLLHVPVAEQEPVIQPHRVADDLSGKAMALVEGRWLVHGRVLPFFSASPPELL